MSFLIFTNAFLFAMCTFSPVSCEYFSSLGQMEDLIYQESELIASLYDYINAEEDKLSKIKRFASEIKEQSDTAKANVDRFLSHPVNQYRLMKRLAHEWIDIEDLVTEGTSDVFLTNLTIKKAHFPNDDDTKGTAQAIMRLQDTYKLDTHDFARGVIFDSKSNSSLTAEDCFYIGRTAYLEKDFYHCALWMNEALNKDDIEDISKFDVLDHLSYCVAQHGNLQKAYEITAEMLEIDPDHERIQGNFRHYRDLLGARKKGDEGDDRSDVSILDSIKRQNDDNDLPERHLYERLCRGEKKKITAKVQRNLKCYYWTNFNRPELIIGPVKIEELWNSPHLIRFLDIYTDDEIDVIKSLAKPRLRRATVQNPITGVLEFAHYRVSKSAWLTNEDHKVIGRVCNRIEIVTGLSMVTAEELQVANYGVGGQYEPHYDYARESDAGQFRVEIGNRIATFIAYLSNIEHGGRTVFLDPGIGVEPIKGSAAFWYNLLPSGEGDLRTRHAACPVLTGVKWVSNKWIHERGQEFRRQCNVNQYADNKIF